MSEQLVNNATSVLTSTINNSTTSLSVASATAFPSTGNFRIILEQEIMKVTAVSGSTFTVARGQEGTTAVAHFSGIAVTFVLTQAGINGFRTDNIVQDIAANRPSAATAGMFYFPTDDSGSLAYDDGSAWHTFSLYSFPLTSPSTGNFGTSLGTGTSTFTQNDDSIIFDQPGNNTGTVQTNAKVKTVTPAVTITAELSHHWYPTTTGTAILGLMIQDSSSGNTEVIGVGQTSVAGATTRALIVIKFSYSTDFTSPTNLGTPLANSYWPEVPRFLRIVQPTSSNRLFQYSIDGQRWITYFSEAFNSFAASVDRAGFLLYADGTVNSNGGTIPGHLTTIIRSYLET